MAAPAKSVTWTPVGLGQDGLWSTPVHLLRCTCCCWSERAAVAPHSCCLWKSRMKYDGVRPVRPYWRNSDNSEDLAENCLLRKGWKCLLECSATADPTEKNIFCSTRLQRDIYPGAWGGHAWKFELREDFSLTSLQTSVLWVSTYKHAGLCIYQMCVCLYMVCMQIYMVCVWYMPYVYHMLHIWIFLSLYRYIYSFTFLFLHMLW